MTDDLVERLRARAASEDGGGNEAAAERAMMGMEAKSDLWAERVNLNDLIKNIVNVGRLKDGTPTDVRESFIKRQRELIDALMRPAYLEGYLEGGLSRKAYDVELDRSSADTIASLRRERDEARQIVRDIYWMALRYADGRKSYAVGMCNDAVQKAYDGGWITPKDQGGDPITPRLARDGMAAEWLDISARAHAAEAQVANLTEQVRQAFLDGVTYASNVEVTDLELAWEQSRARAALQKDKT